MNNISPDSPRSSSALPPALDSPDSPKQEIAQKPVQVNHVSKTVIPMNLVANRLLPSAEPVLLPAGKKRKMNDIEGSKEADSSEAGAPSDQTAKPAFLSHITLGLQPRFGTQKEQQQPNDILIPLSNSGEDQNNQLKKEEKSDKEGSERVTTPEQSHLPEPSTPPDAITKPCNTLIKKKKISLPDLNSEAFASGLSDGRGGIRPLISLDERFKRRQPVSYPDFGLSHADLSVLNAGSGHSDPESDSVSSFFEE